MGVPFPLTKLAFVQTTIIAIVIALAALLSIVAATLWLVGETRTYSDTVTQARLQRTAIVELRGLLDDAETGQRGYLLTNDEAYLAPYLAAKAKVTSELDEVRSLLRHDALDRRRARSARPSRRRKTRGVAGYDRPQQSRQPRQRACRRQDGSRPRADGYRAPDPRRAGRGQRSPHFPTP